MKLQAKLAFTYGILISAMLATSTVAYLHMSEVNRKTRTIISERVPIIKVDRDARLRMGKGVDALEDFMVFGADPAAAQRYRGVYRDEWSRADATIAVLRELADRYDLGTDRARLPVIVAQVN